MNKTLKKIIISALLVIVGGGLNFYTTLPAINPRSTEFWSFLSFIIFLALLPFIFVGKSKVVKKSDNGKGTYVNIDFKSLKKRNDDIYGWIEIKGTQINYPIVQSWEEDDSFYLNHNVDKQYDINGAIYTEKHNNLTFTDPNTLIYGHDMLDGSMFQNLHKFRNKEFFDKHKYIYIYTEGHILKYEIFAAYKSDNKHILNSYDFSDEKVYAEYLKNAQNPKSLMVNKRDCNLTTEDRIITLSTCIGNEKNYRYLVQGVLIDDTLTK